MGIWMHVYVLFSSFRKRLPDWLVRTMTHWKRQVILRMILIERNISKDRLWNWEIHSKVFYVHSVNICASVYDQLNHQIFLWNILSSRIIEMRLRSTNIDFLNKYLKASQMWIKWSNYRGDQVNSNNLFQMGGVHCTYQFNGGIEPFYSWWDYYS